MALSVIAAADPVPSESSFTDSTSPSGETTISTSKDSSASAALDGGAGIAGPTSRGGTTSTSAAE